MIRLAVCILLAGGLLLSLWPGPTPTPSGTPHTLAIQAADGTPLRSFRPGAEQYVRALGDLPPLATDALLAVEDRAFFWHPGVNPQALLRAALANMRAQRIVEGGSTISMQVAHMRGAPRGNRWLTKLGDMLQAVRLEITLSKSDLLTAWLNEAPFGLQTQGLEAASLRYFSKPAHDLTDAETLFLIGLPQGPSRYHPIRYPDRARKRFLHVVDALYSTGTISESERSRFQATPFSFRTPAASFQAPHFAARLAHAAEKLPSPVVSVQTTLDRRLQHVVETTARAFLRELEDAGVGTLAAVVLENATGNVLAYLGSADFWDEAAHGQNDGVQMLRQPGSTVKPFMYAQALQDGRVTVGSILADVPFDVQEAGGAFSPQNYDQTFHGPVSLRQALASSYNVPAVRVAQSIGATKLLKTLRQAGLESLTQPAEHYGVGLTLGNGEVRLIDLATAYMGLANGGTVRSPRYARWWLTATGDTVHVPLSQPRPTGLTPEVSYLITDILQDPEARAPAFGRFSPLELPFPAAVKTGTSKDYRDNWAVGYTPAHTVAVWAGNFDGAPMQFVSGVTGAGTLLNTILRYLGDQGPFAQPTTIVSAQLCPHSGLLPQAACPTVRTEVFLPGTVPADTCNVHQLVRIDRLTGLRATDTTPADRLDKRLYTVYPPLFHDWMRTQQIDFPPPAALARVAGDSTTWTSTRELRIDYPEDGAVFLKDQVLRDAYQQIMFAGHAPSDVYHLQWWLNEQSLPSPFDATAWTLAPGLHTLELRGIRADGTQVRSHPVTFRVAAP